MQLLQLSVLYPETSPGAAEANEVLFAETICLHPVREAATYHTLCSKSKLRRFLCPEIRSTSSPPLKSTIISLYRSMPLSFSKRQTARWRGHTTARSPNNEMRVLGSRLRFTWSNSESQTLADNLDSFP